MVFRRARDVVGRKDQRRDKRAVRDSPIRGHVRHASHQEMVRGMDLDVVAIVPQVRETRAMSNL